MVGLVRILVALCLLLASAAALRAQAPPIGPLSPIPITDKTIAVGAKLYYDPRLSQAVNVNGVMTHTVSCASCHDPYQGYTQHTILAEGILGRTGQRNSPTTLNAVYSPLMFWDGRTRGMPTQSLLPIVNRLEMGNQTEGQVLQRLRQVGYEPWFRDAYGIQRNGTAITRETYGHALLSFQSTIVAGDTPALRRLKGDTKALSPDAEIGYGIFLRSNCMSCHKPPLFTDLQFHNNGAEFSSRGSPQDDGRAGLQNQNTGNNLRAFKTPQLIAISDTYPYMHNGRFTTLERVVQHYGGGGAKLQNGQTVRDSNTDLRVQRIRLNASQQQYLVKFLTEAFVPYDYPIYPRPSLPGIGTATTAVLSR